MPSFFVSLHVRRHLRARLQPEMAHERRKRFLPGIRLRILAHNGEKPAVCIFRVVLWAVDARDAGAEVRHGCIGLSAA